MRTAETGRVPTRADRLLGAGDSYIVTPSATHRAQLAYIPAGDLERMNTGMPDLTAWPEADPEAAGTLPACVESPRWDYSGAELAVALVNANKGKGRPSLVKAIEAAGLGKPGVEKATRLLGLGRDMRAWLDENAWCLSVCQDGTHDSAPVDVEFSIK